MSRIQRELQNGSSRREEALIAVSAQYTTFKKVVGTGNMLTRPECEPK
jgi:hypothetical protein